MNALQTNLGERARTWINCHCKETISNGGNCIDDLTIAFTGKRAWRAPYCAMTVWVWYYEASLASGLLPMLPKIASAIGLLNACIKNGFAVDDTPDVGSIFYRKSSLQGKKNGSEISGHCGIVLGWTDNEMVTAEGNSGQQIHEVRTPWSRVRDPERGYRFIHAERVLVPNMMYGPVFLQPPPSCGKADTKGKKK